MDAGSSPCFGLDKENVCRSWPPGDRPTASLLWRSGPVASSTKQQDGVFLSLMTLEVPPGLSCIDPIIRLVTPEGALEVPLPNPPRRTGSINSLGVVIDRGVPLGSITGGAPAAF